MYRFAQAYVYSILSIRSEPVGILVAAFVESGIDAVSVQMQSISATNRHMRFIFFAGTFYSSEMCMRKEKSYSYFIIFYHNLSIADAKIYIYVYKRQIILDIISSTDMQNYAKKRITLSITVLRGTICSASFPSFRDFCTLCSAYQRRTTFLLHLRKMRNTKHFSRLARAMPPQGKSLYSITYAWFLTSYENTMEAVAIKRI